MKRWHRFRMKELGRLMSADGWKLSTQNRIRALAILCSNYEKKHFKFCGFARVNIEEEPSQNE